MPFSLPTPLSSHHTLQVLVQGAPALGFLFTPSVDQATTSALLPCCIVKTTSALAFVGWQAIAIALCRSVSPGSTVSSEEQLALVHVCLPSTQPNSWSLAVPVRKTCWMMTWLGFCHLIPFSVCDLDEDLKHTLLTGAVMAREQQRVQTEWPV